MNERLPDTWHARELPVLREAARILEAEAPGTGARVQEIAQALSLDPDTVYRAVSALRDDGLIDIAFRAPVAATRVTALSGDARRHVGLWPTEETALDRMIAALEAIASNTDDDVTRSNARKFADWLRSGATTVGLSVASAAITGQLPGAGS